MYNMLIYLHVFPTVIKKIKNKKKISGTREMLGGSVSDLRRTMSELQERLQTVDGEGKLK